MTREEAKSVISKLVERFREHRDEYYAADYNETKARIGFINPFFSALGWDVGHAEDVREDYREVIHEDKVNVKGKIKAPDYGFRVAGQGEKRLFFVEAKKPSVALKVNREAAYQLRRYGRSAQAPVSILTNFEEFIVYDCTKTPGQHDSATVARLKYIGFEDYVKEFDFIYDTFSREAVYKGRFEKFVVSDTYKKGTQTLDKDFVESLDKWRKYLAVSIALNNLKLNEEEINFAVQQTIDRFIFLRFCEDRGVEPYGQLQKAVSIGDAYKHLFDIFQQADDKYNSGLFDLANDKISEKLKVDNKVLKTIVNELYYPECPYDFRVMPVEVLGNAYEQFLGKVIRITTSHSAKVEEKPEVRKAGGVYYTPQYIVEYIVKNTVGKLIEGKTPKEIEKIKIVDPACGSGSFLLGAFQYLMNYHTNWYHEKGYATKKAKDNPLGFNGRLTTTEKKKILLNNIYGVDLDANAVEVSKLSLLLKCMEGETADSIKQQLTMYHERVLPNLDNNIKSGNSLIDLDFDREFDFGGDKKIKPFSWKIAFPEVFKIRKNELASKLKAHYNKVMKQADDAEEIAQALEDKIRNTVEEPPVKYGDQGGFDIVIGNPPYGATLSEEELAYFKTNYSTSVWRGETYLLFIERSLRLLREDGLLGFIIPDTLLNLGFTQSLREYLLQNSHLKEIVSLPSNVFSGATVDTILLFAEKKEQINTYYKTSVDVKVFDKRTTINILDKPTREFSANTNDWFKAKSFNLQTDKGEQKIVLKVEKDRKKIEDVANILYGIKVYQVGKGKPPQTEKIRDTKPYTSEKKENKQWLPFFDGKHIGRYNLYWENNNWLNYGDWLAEPRNSQLFEGEKILIRKITGKTLIATYVSETSYCNTLLFVLKLKTKSYSYKSILGILNSSLIGWYFKKKFQIGDDDTFPQIMIRDILQFPVPEISTKNDNELTKHVDSLLKLNEELKEVKIASKAEQVKQRIAHSEERINELVYGLYDLTPDEIKIIENQNG